MRQVQGLKFKLWLDSSTQGAACPDSEGALRPNRGDQRAHESDILSMSMHASWSIGGRHRGDQCAHESDISSKSMHAYWSIALTTECKLMLFRGTWHELYPTNACFPSRLKVRRLPFTRHSTDVAFHGRLAHGVLFALTEFGGTFYILPSVLASCGGVGCLWHIEYAHSSLESAI